MATGYEFFVFKVLLYFVFNSNKILKKCGDKNLDGVWCVCWKCEEDSEEYEIGSLEINHFFDNISGLIYCQDRKWPVYGKRRNDKKIDLWYKDNEGRIGEMYFEIETNQISGCRVIGRWGGYVNYFTRQYVRKDMQKQSLPIYAAKGDQCSKFCQGIELGKIKGGSCIEVDEVNKPQQTLPIS